MEIPESGIKKIKEAQNRRNWTHSQVIDAIWEQFKDSMLSYSEDSYRRNLRTRKGARESWAAICTVLGLNLADITQEEELGQNSDLEPVAMVVEALSEGVSQSQLGNISEEYQELMVLVREKLVKVERGDIILDEFINDVETYGIPLEKKLLVAEVDNDEVILDLAQNFLKGLTPKSLPSDKSNRFNNVFNGEVKGIQMGDYNQQTNH